jgi:hypothetical protein
MRRLSHRAALLAVMPGLADCATDSTAPRGTEPHGARQRCHRPAHGARGTVRLARTFTVAASFALSAAACSDAPLVPSQAAPHPHIPILPAVESGTVGFKVRELPIGGRVMVQGPITSLVSYDEVYDGLVWSSSDARVAALSPTGNGVWIQGIEPGIAVLAVQGAEGGHRMEATALITVLDTADAPSPVVIDDFYLTEYAQGGQWRYAPQVVLRDTSGTIGSAVIASWFELPNIGASRRCAMLRPVYGEPTNVWHGWGQSGPELYLQGPVGYRVPAGATVVAHLTLRIPGPHAKSLTLQGRVVPGTPPTAYREGFDTDLLTCE